MKRLHLGCGKRDFGRGWTNVDIAAFPHVHYVHDVATLPMFADNSFDLIYSSHALTYFDRFDAVGVLTEWKRVLVAGGTLRIARWASISSGSPPRFDTRMGDDGWNSRIEPR